MLRWKYVWYNLLRKPLRTGMTTFAVAMPIVVYVLAMAIVRNVEEFLDQSVKEMRLAVVQKTSIINPLPIGHRRKIEALDPSHQRIISVCSMRWFGGRVPGEQTENYFIAADVDTFPTTYPEFKMTPEQIELWNSDRRAAIVGRAPAGQYGWKIGDVITLESTVPPFVQLELRIVAIPPDAHDSETSFMRYDYLNETVKAMNMRADIASFFFVKCATRADLEYFREEIDRHFADDLDQTKTQDEKAFMETFIAAQFDLPNRLRLLSYVVVAVAVMAAANTMMMSFRDRIGEYAIFKSLGFSPWAVACLLLTESLVVVIAGGGLGAGLPYAAFNWTGLSGLRIPGIGLLQIHGRLVGEAMVVAVFVGLVSGIVPALRVVRLGVVEALRRIG
ncbi:MAG: ABC transporter permease [Phycisphaerae bacterium]